jgi:hypothetical protein
MAIDEYVNQILNSPAYVFDEIVGKLIGNNIKNAKIELLRHTTDVDSVLFEAIKSIIEDLREEEGLVSRFFYNIFGIELIKNKRREQLIVLGTQLKTQHAKVKSELFRVYRHTQRLSLSITDLRRLEKSFRRRNIYINSEQMLNKSNFFISEIEEKITLLQEYQNFLESKHNSIMDIEKVYNALEKKIPRYHELEEECSFHLLSSRRVEQRN